MPKRGFSDSLHDKSCVPKITQQVVYVNLFHYVFEFFLNKKGIKQGKMLK